MEEIFQEVSCENVYILDTALLEGMYMADVWGPLRTFASFTDIVEIVLTHGDDVEVWCLIGDKLSDDLSADQLGLLDLAIRNFTDFVLKFVEGQLPAPRMHNRYVPFHIDSMGLYMKEIAYE